MGWVLVMVGKFGSEASLRGGTRGVGSCCLEYLRVGGGLLRSKVWKGADVGTKPPGSSLYEDFKDGTPPARADSILLRAAATCSAYMRFFLSSMSFCSPSRTLRSFSLSTSCLRFSACCLSICSSNALRSASDFKNWAFSWRLCF